VVRQQGKNSDVLSGQLTATDTVTQYGQGYSTFASGTFGTPSAVAATGLGTYRSAQFTPSNITTNSYQLQANSSSQVGHGGDSGGPSVVTVNGYGVGIAGVQSTCNGTFLPGSPQNPVNWLWATSITSCSYQPTAPFIDEILNVTKATPDLGGTLFQRHTDGSIWKYNDQARCTAAACPGWRQIDRNNRTKDIVTANGRAYQLHVDGRIWKYDGIGRCTTALCPGWVEIDRNPATASLAGGNSGLYQLHVDGSIWKYNGGDCTVAACTSWTEIDHNPHTTEIVAANGIVFQRHADGGIWRYAGAGQCTPNACTGWSQIDQNNATAAIAGGTESGGSVTGRGGFYQLHADGRIFKYDGKSICNFVKLPGQGQGVHLCRGWTELDRNPNTKAIVASGSALYQLHADGKIWKYDGKTTCTVNACTGWTEIDHNPTTAAITAVEPG
jgi:hypothetical protein